MAVHPGMMIRPELEERGISQKEFAKMLGTQPSHLSEVLNGKRAITTDLAMKIENAIGLPAKILLSAQAQYELESAGSSIAEDKQHETVTVKQNMITLKGKDPKMIANNLKPFKPTHPGEVLKDELEFRGISQRGMAKKMDISYSALNEVLNGNRALNPELAMMMEAALGVDAAQLLAMQNEYDMQMAERNETFMEKLKHLRRIAAIF